MSTALLLAHPELDEDEVLRLPKRVVRQRRPIQPAPPLPRSNQEGTQ